MVDFNLDDVKSTFGKVSTALGATLDLNSRFQGAYQWLFGLLQEKDNQITSLTIELEEAQRKLTRAQLMLAHHNPIPKDKLTRDHIKTFERIKNITGVDIPPVQWSEQMFDTCYKMLEKLYVRDPLTDLLSTHSYSEQLEDIIKQRRVAWKSYKDDPQKPKSKMPPPCTVIVCDLNSFKSYNSEIGYENTDHALQKIAGVLRKEANRYVVIPEGMTDPQKIKEEQEKQLPVARMNAAGDEFVMIMHCDRVEAEKRMSDMKKQLSSYMLRFLDENGKPNITVSNMTMSYGCHELDSTLVDGPNNNRLRKINSPISAMAEASTRMQEYKQMIKEKNEPIESRYSKAEKRFKEAQEELREMVVGRRPDISIRSIVRAEDIQKEFLEAKEQLSHIFSVRPKFWKGDSTINSDERISAPSSDDMPTFNPQKSTPQEPDGNNPEWTDDQVVELLKKENKTNPLPVKENRPLEEEDRVAALLTPINPKPKEPDDPQKILDVSYEPEHKIGKFGFARSKA